MKKRTAIWSTLTLATLASLPLSATAANSSPAFEYRCGPNLLDDSGAPRPFLSASRYGNEVSIDFSFIGMTTKGDIRGNRSFGPRVAPNQVFRFSLPSCFFTAEDSRVVACWAPLDSRQIMMHDDQNQPYTVAAHALSIRVRHQVTTGPAYSGAPNTRDKLVFSVEFNVKRPDGEYDFYSKDLEWDSSDCR